TVRGGVPAMRLRFVVAAMTMCALGYAFAGTGLFAQGRGQAPATGTLAPPAVYPHDMTTYQCAHFDEKACDQVPAPPPMYDPLVGRSEEHTSELQSRRDLVCRLLLEKK